MPFGSERTHTLSEAGSNLSLYVCTAMMLANSHEFAARAPPQELAASAEQSLKLNSFCEFGGGKSECPSIDMGIFLHDECP
jgi:hypothetical protein